MSVLVFFSFQCMIHTVELVFLILVPLSSLLTKWYLFPFFEVTYFIMYHSIG